MSLATTEHGTPEAVSGHSSSAHGAASHGKKGLGNPVLGMLLFIVSEIMFFGGLFAAYFSLRVSAGTWPPEGNEAFLIKEHILFPSILTLLLWSTALKERYCSSQGGGPQVCRKTTGRGGALVGRTCSQT